MSNYIAYRGNNMEYAKIVEDAKIQGMCHCGFDSITDKCVYIYSKITKLSYIIRSKYTNLTLRYACIGEYFFDKNVRLSEIMGKTAEDLLPFAK